MSSDEEMSVDNISSLSSGRRRLPKNSYKEVDEDDDEDGGGDYLGKAKKSSSRGRGRGEGRGRGRGSTSSKVSTPSKGGGCPPEKQPPKHRNEVEIKQQKKGIGKPSPRKRIYKEDLESEDWESESGRPHRVSQSDDEELKPCYQVKKPRGRGHDRGRGQGRGSKRARKRPGKPRKSIYAEDSESDECKPESAPKRKPAERRGKKSRGIMMADFVLSEAEEDFSDNDDYNEEERKKLNKLKKALIQSDSSEEEEEDDEEALHKESKGSIVGEDSDNLGSDGENGKRKRARKTSARSRKKIPLSKNPITLLRQMFSGDTVKYHENKIDQNSFQRYKCIVEVKGHQYNGEGKSQKGARRNAAEVAVRAQMHYQTGDTNTGVETTSSFKRPYSYDSTASTKQLKKEIPQGKSPITLLFEMSKGRVNYIHNKMANKCLRKCECIVEVNGQKYSALGRSGKGAQRNAAIVAVRALMELLELPEDYEKPEAASTKIAISNENKGFKMLAALGWKEGEGLGKDKAGRLEPVPGDEIKLNKAGIGSTSVAPPPKTCEKKQKKGQIWTGANKKKQKNGQILTGANLIPIPGDEGFIRTGVGGTPVAPPQKTFLKEQKTEPTYEKPEAAPKIELNPGEEFNFLQIKQTNENREAASMNKAISNENKGFKMLAALGWKEGEGLGKDKTGRVEPTGSM